MMHSYSWQISNIVFLLRKKLDFQQLERFPVRLRETSFGRAHFFLFLLSTKAWGCPVCGHLMRFLDQKTPKNIGWTNTPCLNEKKLTFTTCY